MNLKNLFITLTFSIILSSCSIGGKSIVYNSNWNTFANRSNELMDNLEEALGVTNFHVIKDKTTRGEPWIIYKRGSQYFALNMTGYNFNSTPAEALDFYNTAVTNGDNKPVSTVGVVDIYAPLNTYRDADGFLYEETKGMAKDLEKLGFKKESFKKAIIANSLEADYGLSNERALKLGNLMVNFKRTLSKRAISKGDINSIFNTALGMDFETFKKGIKSKIEGDEKTYEGILDQAARANGISPEHLETVLEAILI